MTNGSSWPDAPIDQSRLNGRCLDIAAIFGVRVTGSRESTAADVRRGSDSVSSLRLALQRDYLRALCQGVDHVRPLLHQLAPLRQVLSPVVCAPDFVALAMR